jgi:excisionase family DNA binding protein
MKSTQFYTCEEVAEMLRLNIMTIYRYIKAGRLQAHKFGKDYRITSDELKQFLESTKTS